MKTLGLIIKIVVALAAVAAAVYVAVTYGDKIVAWAKNMLAKIGCRCGCGCSCECDCDCSEEAIEEVSVEEAASEADFEG